MSKRQRTEENSAEKAERQTSNWVVFVLVKTADKEGDDDESDEDEFGECKAESEVIGVYRSHSQAEKSKDKETEGMETSDGFTFHTPNGGKPYYTTFEIHKEVVQDDDGEDDGEDEEDEEEEDSDVNDEEEDDQRDSDEDDEPDSDENDEIDSDDDDVVEIDNEEGGGTDERKESSFNGPSGSGMEQQIYDEDADEFMDSEDEDSEVEIVELPPVNHDDDDDDDDDDDNDDDDDDDDVPVQGQGGDWSGRPGHH